MLNSQREHDSHHDQSGTRSKICLELLITLVGEVDWTAEVIEAFEVFQQIIFHKYYRK